MNSIYITSVERYSGKTATCLALGKRLIADGYNPGYLKPLSLQPYLISGNIADEDAVFVKEILGLDAQPWDLSPIVVTPEFLHERLLDKEKINLMSKVKAAAEVTGAGKDLLILEGGASMREGYAVGLPTLDVAEELGTNVLALIKYRDEIRVLDDTLAARRRLGDLLCGIIINRVPDDAIEFVHNTVVPYIENLGLPVYGVLYEKRGLEALTVNEIAQVLEARILTKDPNLDALVETLTVGAMTADAALSRFRKQINKAVITGGDRTDIQLAALETSTTTLILTGNLHPSPLIIKQAEEFNVSVLLVPTNTMETIESLERIFGKTRLGQASKLAQFEEIFNEYVDVPRLYKRLGISGQKETRN